MWALPVSSVSCCCIVLPGYWAEGGPLECLSPVCQGPDDWIKDIRMSMLFPNQQGTSCLLSFCLHFVVPCEPQQQLSTNRKIFWPVHRNLNTCTYFTVAAATWWLNSPIWAPYVSQAPESFLQASPWTVTAIAAVSMSWEVTGPFEEGSRETEQPATPCTRHLPLSRVSLWLSTPCTVIYLGLKTQAGVLHKRHTSWPNCIKII